MKSFWKAAAAVASLVLASCGGGGNAAISKTFNYSAAQAPNANEQSAATSAQGAVSTTSTFNTTPDSNNASLIIGLADELAVSALGGSPVGASPIAQDPRLRHAMRNAVTADCTVVTATSVTFSNCTEMESGYSFTLSGNITAAAGTVTWDIHGAFTGSNNGISINLNLHQSGALTVTSTTVVGQALSEMSGSVSGQGQTVSFGLDTAAMVNLTYNQTCVTSGTLEVKRVWSERPQGASGPDFADVAVKLTWTGCNTIQVQHST
jgi:hypothetical protein